MHEYLVLSFPYPNLLATQHCHTVVATLAVVQNSKEHGCVALNSSALDPARYGDGSQPQGPQVSAKRPPSVL